MKNLTPYAGTAEGDRRQAVSTGSHLLVSGPTGVGKTRRVLAPGILSWTGPVVALSSKGDLIDLCAEHRARRGRVYVLNLGVADVRIPHGATRLRVDPVRAVTTSDEAVDLASLLLATGSLGAGDGSGLADGAFWKTQAVFPLAALIWAARLHDDGMEWVCSALASPSLISPSPGSNPRAKLAEAETAARAAEEALNKARRNAAQATMDAQEEQADAQTDADAARSAQDAAQAAQQAAQKAATGQDEERAEAAAIAAEKAAGAARTARDRAKAAKTRARRAQDRADRAGVKLAKAESVAESARRAVERAKGEPDQPLTPEVPTWGDAVLRLLMASGNQATRMSEALAALAAAESRFKQGVVANMTEAVTPYLRESVASTSEVPVFTPDLLDDGSTLFVVAPMTGVAAGAACALVDSLITAWRRKAGHAPQLLAVIDELVNICPLPNFITYVTEARGLGVAMVAAVQNSEQLRLKWGEAGRDVLRRVFPATLVLLGAEEREILEEAAWRAGLTEVWSDSYSHDGTGRGSRVRSSRRDAPFTAAELLPRSMDEGRLVLRDGTTKRVELRDLDEMRTR